MLLNSFAFSIGKLSGVGLGVSVPAAIYYFYFKNKATKILLGMEALTMDTIKVLRNVEVVQD